MGVDIGRALYPMGQLQYEAEEQLVVVVKDFKCPGCQVEALDVFCAPDASPPLCFVCGAEMERFFSQGSKFHPFKEGFYEHLDIEPVYVTSKRQLKDECKKRGLSSPYAWD